MKTNKRYLTIQKRAKAEAIRLREHATQEELARLNLHNLGTTDPDRCIYGQMTGNCNNERAVELIVKSAERVFHTDGGYLTFEKTKLNGKPTVEDRNDYYSPIELYIYHNRRGFDSNLNKKLIDFLQGKSEDFGD